MSRGYIVIAQNNDTVDYLEQAYALALNLKLTQSTVNNLTVCVDATTKKLIKAKHKIYFLSRHTMFDAEESFFFMEEQGMSFAELMEPYEIHFYKDIIKSNLMIAFNSDERMMADYAKSVRFEFGECG